MDKEKKNSYVNTQSKCAYRIFFVCFVESSTRCFNGQIGNNSENAYSLASVQRMYTYDVHTYWMNVDFMFENSTFCMFFSSLLSANFTIYTVVNFTLELCCTVIAEISKKAVYCILLIFFLFFFTHFVLHSEL